MPQTQSTQHLISTEEYLAAELTREERHELINNQVVMMAGASANHQRITVNILTEFRNHLKLSACEPFSADMKVKTGSNFFYPDTLIDCQFDEAIPYYTETPSLIVEVLSKSTRRTDETTKEFAYINIPSLQEYVLIEQDFVDI